MAPEDGDPAVSWPDHEEWATWQRAMGDVARRLTAERGIDDPWRLDVGWDALWAEYGDLRLCVAGGPVDVEGPDDLWTEVDSWVAFERRSGPGQVLDRDRRVMAARQQRMPALRQFWLDIAARVFRDVEASTSLRLAWDVVVHEDDLVWPGILDGFPGVDSGVYGSILSLDAPPPVRRPLAFPEVWLETPHTGRGLPDMTDEDDATSHLADLVQEDVMEEVHGAWPQCPRHPHPLGVGSTDAGRPAWICPTTSDVVALIGELGPPG